MPNGTVENVFRIAGAFARDHRMRSDDLDEESITLSRGHSWWFGVTSIRLTVRDGPKGAEVRVEGSIRFLTRGQWNVDPAPFLYSMPRGVARGHVSVLVSRLGVRNPAAVFVHD